MSEVQRKIQNRFRSSSFFSSTQSICPVCRKLVQGKILIGDGQVLLWKRCLEHGEFQSLLSSDTRYWMKSLTYTKPGQIPAQFSTNVEQGCAYDCGLCSDHEQHTCVPIFEITNRCDLTCPVCLVWNQHNYDISFDDFKKSINALLAKESTLDILLLSGGEPTLHPEFFKLASYAREHRAIKRVVISSHGLKFAKDEDFVKQFRDYGLYLSLQFDSLKEEVYQNLRGANLLKHKMKCLEMCEKYGIATSIVPTIAHGFNDNEIGAIIDFAFSHDFITAVTLQPIAYTGAGGTSFPQDPLQKLSHIDIHKKLTQQTDWLTQDDFLAVPCSHPSCYTVCYILKSDNGKLIPLTRFNPIASYLDCLSNKALLNMDRNTEKLIRDSIYKLWSAQSITADGEDILKSLKSILEQYQKNCLSSKDDFLKLSEKNIKAIFIHAFMDEYDFDISRIRKCCNHYVLADGRLIPGCSYNNLHRFQDKRLGLDKVVIPERQCLIK